ncbi:MAG: hypothetical protein H5U06_04300 [Candidatus Aminicenantes bacterium]|nr:hypothetical protein [Candidatus Aminicenantes bacterium]
MELKDIEKMTDEELREYTKKIYDQLDKIPLLNRPACAGCLVKSCPYRKMKVNDESETTENED